jgi:hypothetical protein
VKAVNEREATTSVRDGIAIAVRDETRGFAILDRNLVLSGECGRSPALSRVNRRRGGDRRDFSGVAPSGRSVGGVPRVTARVAISDPVRLRRDWPSPPPSSVAPRVFQAFSVDHHGVSEHQWSR